MPQYNHDTAQWYAAEPMQREEADAWYAGPSGAASYYPPSDAEEAAKQKKKRRRTKILALCLCAVVLAGAILSVLSAAEAARKSRQSSARSASTAPYAQSGGDYQKDYRAYFAEYYSQSSAVAIRSASAEPGVSVELRSRAGREELSLQEVYQLVNPAVVGVSAWRDGTEFSTGTGVIFRSDGYIITNTHILQGADAAIVTLADGRSVEAALIGEDEESDIAVLRIDETGLPQAEFGDSDELQVGEEVAAIGNPLGAEYAGTMTNGIISSIERSVANQGHRMTLLQTNAALNEGNSGGPLVNMYGQVVGITNMKIMSVYYTNVEGIGFAIPSSTVRTVANQLLASGIVSGEPTIGITAGPVTDEAIIVYGLPVGVYVTEVRDGSDAKAQGLLAGDIITKVNGITVETVADVNEIKGSREVGDTLRLTVYRDGKTFELDVKLVDKADVFGK